MRRFKAVGAVVLAVGLVASPMTAYATDPNVDEVTGLQYSSSLSATAQFTGTAKTAAGQAFPNARVELIAWPRNSVLAGLAEDAVVPTVVVAVDRTSSTGAFKLTPTAASLYPYATAAGAVDFEVAVYANGLESSRFLDSVPNLGNPNARSAEATTTTLTTSLGDFTLTTSPETYVDSTADTTTTPLKIRPCYWAKKASAGAKWAVVGAAYIRKTGATAKFYYRASSESKLGIAIKLAATGAAWQASGTSTVTVDNEDGFPTLTGIGNRKWRTQWEYYNFTRTCTATKQVRAVELIGGTSSLSMSGTPVTVGQCAYYEPDTHKEKVNGTATSFATGVDLGTAIGIDVTSQTNYSTTAKIRFDFDSYSKLCGTTGTPGGNSSGTLVVLSP